MLVGAREIEKNIEGNLCQLLAVICPKSVVIDELICNFFRDFLLLRDVNE